jgi:glutathione S-transferase
LTDPNGRVYNQSGAILRSLGAQLGYYPTEWQLVYACNWAMDTIDDFRSRDHFRHNFASHISQVDLDACVADAHKLNILYEAHLKSHGGKYLVGSKITVADFKALSWYHSNPLNTMKKHPALTDALKSGLDKTPTLTRYLEGMTEEMKEHLASRPQSFY